MQEVSRSVFYATIGEGDVISRILPGKHPYTTVFQFRSGAEIGRIVPASNDRKAYPIQYRYFLRN